MSRAKADKSTASSLDSARSRMNERLVDLVIALRTTRKPVTASWLATKVINYEGSEESRQRQVRRDLTHLKNLDLPLVEMEEPDMQGQILTTYCLDSRVETLDIQLTAEETNIVAVASEYALTGDLAAVGRRGWRKLAAARSLTLDYPFAAVGDAVDLSAPDLAALLEASSHNTVVEFNYFRTFLDEPSIRRVEPWAVVAYLGRWYLSCFDLGRTAPRVFRLSRLSDVESTGQAATHTDLKDTTDFAAMVRESVTGGNKHKTSSVGDARIRCAESIARAIDPHARQDGSDPQLWQFHSVDYEHLVELCISHPDEITCESPEFLRGRIADTFNRIYSALTSFPINELSAEDLDVEGSDHSLELHQEKWGVAEKNKQDLIRLMSIIPYLRKHPGVSLFEAARDLDVSPRSLKDDLTTLQFCGRPGLGGGDLIEINADPRHLELIDDQGLGAPVVLTPSEASVLVLALETVKSVPQLSGDPTIDQTLAKLRPAAGREIHSIVTTSAAEHGDDVDSRKPASSESHAHGLITEALETFGLVEFDYRRPESLESSERRRAIPGDVFVVGSHVYFRGLDVSHSESASESQIVAEWLDKDDAELGSSIRQFRLDRMSNVEIIADTSAQTGENAGLQEQLTRRVRTYLKKETNPLDPFGFHKSESWSRVWISDQSKWLLEYEQLWLVGDSSRGVIADVPGTSQWVWSFVARHDGRVIPLAPQSVRDQAIRRAHSGVVRYR